VHWPRPRRRLGALGGLAALLTLAAERPAQAQLRWDAGVHAGVTKRFTSGGDATAPAPGFGPSFGLQAHVALVPMVRLGGYFEGDVSPASPEAPRAFWAGGLHARFMPPLLGGAWRTWLYAGFGVASAYSYERHLGGDVLELPVGLGLGRKIGGPWLLYAEVGVRVGLASLGDMYGRPDDAHASAAAPFLGQDSFALGASVGLSLEE
jgi:hypothetical protein